MPKIDATKAVLPELEDYIKELSSIWESGVLTNYGEKTRHFQEALKRYTGLSHLELFVNGHSALLLAIRALHLKGEVITSPFTFVSTTNAIVQSGLTPVFGDIDDSYNIDPDCIENLITERTSAIIVPHIFGIPCDVKRIADIAEKHQLKVIYDGAQAFGTKVDQRCIGGFGDITMFSFHANKVFNSIEGGALCYGDAKLKRFFEQSRNFGVSYEHGYDVCEVGMNAKMNEFQAAMGLVNLPHLEEEIQARKQVAERYGALLSGIPGIRCYDYAPEIDYNYAYFPIRVEKERYGISRDELSDRLEKKGIGTRKLYSKLTCDFSCYAHTPYRKTVDHARRITEEALSLPIYKGLSEAEINQVVEGIRCKGC